MLWTDPAVLIAPAAVAAATGFGSGKRGIAITGGSIGGFVFGNRHLRFEQARPIPADGLMKDASVPSECNVVINLRQTFATSNGLSLLGWTEPRNDHWRNTQKLTGVHRIPI